MKRNKKSRPQFEFMEVRSMLAGDLGFAGTVAAETTVQPNVEVTPPIDLAVDVGISDQQKENLAQLAQDLNAIHDDSDVTQAQLENLASDVANVLDGATQPSQESIDQLQQTFQAAIEDGQISTVEVIQLKQDFSAVLESANISQDELLAVYEDVLGIVDASNITQDDIDAIASDVTAIREEFQASHPRIGSWK